MTRKIFVAMVALILCLFAETTVQADGKGKGWGQIKKEWKDYDKDWKKHHGEHWDGHYYRAVPHAEYPGYWTYSYVVPAPVPPPPPQPYYEPAPYGWEIRIQPRPAW